MDKVIVSAQLLPVLRRSLALYVGSLITSLALHPDPTSVVDDFSKLLGELVMSLKALFILQHIVNNDRSQMMELGEAASGGGGAKNFSLRFCAITIRRAFSVNPSSILGARRWHYRGAKCLQRSWIVASGVMMSVFMAVVWPLQPLDEFSNSHLPDANIHTCLLSFAGLGLALKNVT